MAENSPYDLSSLFAQFVGRNDLPDIERRVRARLAANPEDFAATLHLGIILSIANQPDEAIAAFDRAAALVPGHAAPFTLKSTLKFRRRFGMPAAPRTRPLTNHAVSMRMLGTNGKFGNQLLQYAFLRLYAREHNLIAEAPDWIGRDLFDLDDPLPSGQYPTANESNVDLFASLNKINTTVYANHDLVGYFGRHTSAWRERRADFRALYSPTHKIRAILERATAELHGRGQTLVAVHIRRGDFGYGPFWIAPAAWYMSWLNGIWKSLVNPVLYIASDDAGAMAEFAPFAPVNAKALGADIPGAEFYLDHYFLSQANHLAISNSTFSFTAAMLNERAREFVRPDPNARELAAFDPWNAEIMLQPNVQAAGFSDDEKTFMTRLLRPADTVVHIGEFGSAWTNLTRALNPNLRVIEFAEDDALDEMRRRRGLPQIDHLIIERPRNFDRVIDGSAETIRHARVDAIRFLPDATARPSVASIEKLQAHGYRFFKTAGDQLKPVTPEEALVSETFTAIHERLLSALSGNNATGLDIPMLCRLHKIRMRGVIHVGAHEGKELAIYNQLGAERVLFIEANPAVFARLSTAMAGQGHVTVINRAICDRYGKVDLHLASFDQSSSLLPFQKLANVYSSIVPAGIVSVDGSTLDGLMEERGLPLSAFNFLAIDVQGAEALVLKGASKTLAHIDAISVEVNFTDLYKDSAEIEDIESALTQAGFRRAGLISAFHPSWGDAFYVRS
jgi:FkbM family methyltransferase